MGGPSDGPRFPGFQVLGILGQGGFGTVFHARRSENGGEVAIKWLHAVCDASAVRRFWREAEFLSKPRHHPHLMSLHEVGQVDGRPYLVLPLYSGGDLKKRIEARDLTVEEVLGLGRDLGSAIAELHRHGVLHRDLKPANVLFDGEGKAVLADFGLALADAQERITATVQVVGTLIYLPLEMLKGADPAPPGDVYALGLVLLEAVAAATGLPERGRGPADPVLLRVRPPRLRALLGRCLQRDPEARPTAAELSARLDEILGGSGLEGPEGAPVQATIGRGDSTRPLPPSEVRSSPPREPASPEESGGPPRTSLGVLAARVGFATLLAAGLLGALRASIPGAPAGPETPRGAEAMAMEARARELRRYSEPFASIQPWNLSTTDPGALAVLTDPRTPPRLVRLTTRLLDHLSETTQGAATREEASRRVAAALHPVFLDPMFQVHAVLEAYRKVEPDLVEASFEVVPEEPRGGRRSLAQDLALLRARNAEIDRDLSALLARASAQVLEVPVVRAWSVQVQALLGDYPDLDRALEELVTRDLPRARAWGASFPEAAHWTQGSMRRVSVARALGCERLAEFLSRLVVLMEPPLRDHLRDPVRTPWIVRTRWHRRLPRIDELPQVGGISSVSLLVTSPSHQEFCQAAALSDEARGALRRLWETLELHQPKDALNAPMHQFWIEALKRAMR